MGEVDFEPLKRLPSMSLVRHLEINQDDTRIRREEDGRKNSDRNRRKKGERSGN